MPPSSAGWSKSSIGSDTNTGPAGGSASPGTKYPLDEIHTAVTEAESAGRNGKVLLAPSQPR